MPSSAPTAPVRAFSKRLVFGSIALTAFVVADIVLFGWLLSRSLSQREMARVLLETREEAEGLAEQLAGRAEARGSDLYLAVASEQETQTYIDRVLRQRELVRKLEIRDAQGRLVYEMQTQETLPAGDEPVLGIGSPELPPNVEQKTSQHEESFEVYDLTVPIGEMGELHIGLSQVEVEARLEVLRSDLRRQTGLVAGATLAVMVTASLVIWWLVRRGRALEEQAAEAEQMAYVGTLAAGLAHEIRNPLNSLSLNMQMLEEELGPEWTGRSTGRLLEITRSELGRLERLATDFLAYARPRPLELRPIRASELLVDVQRLVAAEARERGVVIEIEPASAGDWIEVDREQCDQLLRNLSRNAFEAMEGASRPGRLVLRAKTEPRGVVVEVADNGVGMNDAARREMFELFFSTRKGGTGLGLAIVRRIARDHEVQIEVESQVGVGTTMRLVFRPSDAPALESAPLVEERRGVNVRRSGPRTLPR